MTAVMPVPEVEPAAAHADAERLRRAGRLAAIAGEQVAGTAPSQWFGGAATQYDARRAELARYVDDVRRLSRQAADVLARYADAVAPPVARMQEAAADLEVALALQAEQPAALRAQVLTEQAWADHAAADREYQGAVLDAIDALEAVRVAVGPLAQGPARHLEAGVRRFWQDAVTGPLSLGWALTAGFFVDRDTWWATVEAIPPGAWHAVTNPLQTLDDALAGPEWRDGEWGEAVGAAAAAVAGAGRRPGVEPDVLRLFGRSLADPDAPKPRLQTVEEMLAAVDLEAHEHYELGHALRRHVAVDDAYLEDRLRNGTIYDDATRGPVPRSGKASAWTDQATAEEWITLTLQHHELTLRKWVDSTESVLSLEMAAPAGVGRVMTLARGQPQLSEPTLVKVVLVKKTEGVFIRTAHPDAPTPRRRAP